MSRTRSIREDGLKSSDLPTAAETAAQQRSYSSSNNNNNNAGFRYYPRDAEDIFAEFFGASGDAFGGGSRFRSAEAGSQTSRKTPTNRKAPAIESKLACTLEELYKGERRKMRISRVVPDALGSFADGFPNLFINNANEIRGQHVAFLASFSSHAVIFEQISVIYLFSHLFVASFTLVLPFFPTGSFLYFAGCSLVSSKGSNTAIPSSSITTMIQVDSSSMKEELRSNKEIEIEDCT